MSLPDINFPINAQLFYPGLRGQNLANAWGRNPAMGSAAQRIMGISTSSGTASSSTLSVKQEMEAPFTRFRIHLFSEQAAATNLKVAACVTETARLYPTISLAQVSQPVVGGVTYPAVQASIGSPGWQIGSVAGVTNFDWPGTATADNPKMLTTDWFDICSIPRADGGTLPLIMFRLEHDSSTNGSINTGNISSWLAIAGSGYPWYRIFQAPNISGGGAVTDLTKNLTGSMGTVALWHAIECQYSVPSITVMGVGDSHIEQAGGFSIGVFGTWGYQGCKLLSSPSNPVCWFNAGRAGGPVDIFQPNGLVEIARTKPNVVVYSAGTSNEIAVYSTLTDAKLQYWKSKLGQVIQACNDIGAKLIVYGPIPGSAYNATYEVFRLAMQDHCKTLAAGKIINYLDFESLLGTGASPNRLKPELTADSGTHVNNAGEVLMAQMFADMLRSL